MAAGAPAVALLALAILLGGSSRGGAYPILYLASAGLTLFAMVRFEWGGAIRFDRFLAGLLLFWMAIILSQVVPLPPQVWSELPGRAPLQQGMEMLGVGHVWRPASLDPMATLAAFLTLIPVAALVLLIGRSPQLPARALFRTVAALAVVSAILGLMQAKGGPNSWLYFHDVTNRDSAVGFFANANHLTTLLLVALPMLAALLAEAREGRAGNLMLIALPAFGIVAGIGIWFTRSAAGLLLLLPTLAASAMIAMRRTKILLIAASVLALASAAALAVIGWKAQSLPLPTSFETGEMSRISIAGNTLEAVGAYWPTGSGVGSFQNVYPMFEDPAAVTNVYANHAHNDWLELVLEAGAAGALFGIAFLVWWARCSLRVWAGRSDRGAIWARAASIAIGVILLHSLVDYPVRTPAILTILAACVLILSGGSRSRRDPVQSGDAPRRAQADAGPAGAAQDRGKAR